jgi:hypothetical protein
MLCGIVPLADSTRKYWRRLGARAGLPWMGTWRVILVLCALIPWSTGRKTALVWENTIDLPFSIGPSVASAISLAWFE